MKPYRERKRRLLAEINVVPYIDVMLVLLVIFMITAPLLAQGIKVELPKAAAEPVAGNERDTLVVTVDRLGRFYLDDRAINAATLQDKAARILRAQPDIPVLVRGDRAAIYDHVVRAMVIQKDAGAPNVGLVTTPPGRAGT